MSGTLGSVKRLLSDARFSARRWQAQQRALPNFIIIGAQKAGTSSLFHYLAQHPQVAASIKKEVRFFDGGRDPQVDNFCRGVNWYRAHFPRTRSLAKGTLVGEASPVYMFNPDVAARMHRLLPELKLIALLRDPVERAISHYFHERRRGAETLPIAEALQAEEQRLAASLRAGDYRSAEMLRFSYQLRGLYHQQLATYLQVFPRKQLYLACSEDFFARPSDVLAELFRFLGADDDRYTVKDLRPRNVGANKADVESQVYTQLREYFAEPNQQLYQAFGNDFGWQ